MHMLDFTSVSSLSPCAQAKKRKNSQFDKGNRANKVQANNE